jgi:hypothetical protein
MAACPEAQEKRGFRGAISVLTGAVRGRYQAATF